VYYFVRIRVPNSSNPKEKTLRRESQKRPVLTSPWKIGTLVALLLVAISAGAVYYMVSVYDVELNWLGPEGGRWKIDSFLFFREMYILAAAVVLVAIFSYFIVASAVRRYKFYLDSGQDYRTMISVAESIDDLTNPAQIAKLSDYPELQTVLRNYGDQIREVSQELEQRGQEHRSVDLEIEIESLLRGETVEDTAMEGKWWAPLFRKLAQYTQDNREVVAEIEGRIARIRRVFCNVTLSSGKVLESVGGANEDIVEIMRAIGELSSVAGELKGEEQEDSTADDGPEAAAGPDGLEKALHRLEQGGRELGEYSEESNNLALCIALTAAKGGPVGSDLAQFAEKARVTAERFKEFSAGIQEIAEEIARGCRGAGTDFAPGGVGAHPELYRSLSEISWRIEQRSRSLQQRIMTLENELNETNCLLQSELAELDMHDAPAERDGEAGARDEVDAQGDAAIVNFGAGGDDGSDLVIDHGKLWEDDSFGERMEQGEDALDESAAAAGDNELMIDHGIAPDIPADAGSPAPDKLDETRVIGPPDAAQIRDAAAKPEEKVEPAASASVMEMPGHRWLKVDVEKDEREPVVDVEVREDRGDSVRPMEEREVVAEEIRTPGTADAEKHEEDGEPIYDLFELGAVEYVEETQHH
jgi:hypothetical protein